MSLCLICYIIYQNMEYVGSDERVGSHEKGSCAHRLTRCSYVHSELQNQLFWGVLQIPQPITYIVCARSHMPTCQILDSVHPVRYI